jgi:uncharacterized protein (TIGR02001 family)
MRTLLKTAVAFGALAGVAHAEPSFSGNVAVTTDYTFRGVSQTAEGPAVQGGFDYANGAIYAGAWASNVDLAPGNSVEMDLYAGLRGKLTENLVGDVGVIGYFYPGAADDAAELDYQEIFGKLTWTPVDQLQLGAAVFVSPEFTGELGTGVYAELSAGYMLSAAFRVSGAVGYQQAEDGDFSVGGGIDDAYTTWNLGLTYIPQADFARGFEVDLRYVGTDVDNLDAAEERAVLTVKRAM